MPLQITRIKPDIGASIAIDKSRLLDDAVVTQCHELLEQCGVLVFPRINLTDAEQLEFTDRFGTRVNYVRQVPGGHEDVNPDIYRITLDPKLNPQPEYVQGTFFWHMDGLNSDIPPVKATLLTCRRKSPRGGQTQFANTYAAYESLPEEDKALIANLKVMHTLGGAMSAVTRRATAEHFSRWTHAPDKVHPLVWTHASGRKSLIVNLGADYVIGMPYPDGRALLARLTEWTGQPAFYYSHEWSEGDFVIWDNCGVVHRVMPYDADSGRMMHRTSIAGTEFVQ